MKIGSFKDSRGGTIGFFPESSSSVPWVSFFGEDFLDVSQGDSSEEEKKGTVDAD